MTQSLSRLERQPRLHSLISHQIELPTPPTPRGIAGPSQAHRALTSQRTVTSLSSQAVPAPPRPVPVPARAPERRPWWLSFHGENSGWEGIMNLDPENIHLYFFTNIYDVAFPFLAHEVTEPE